LPFRPGPVASHNPGSRWATAVFAILLGVTAAVGIASWDRLRVWIPALNTGEQGGLVPMRVVQEPLIVPRSSETALDRARALFASGRVHDALRAVDLVRATDPLRDDADKLKAAIQRELLAFQTLPSGAGLTNPTVPANPAISTTP